MNTLAAAALLVGIQAQPGATDLQRAIASFQAGDCPGVVSILTRGTALDPSGGDAPYALLATCQWQLGHTADGIKTARDGVAALPQSGLLKRMLGQQLFREDPLSPEAGNLLEAAMAALPGDPESRHYFAQWAYMNNRDDECAQREREGLRAPNLGPVARLQMYTLIGLCEGRSGDPDAARAAFESAWAINGTLRRFDAHSAYQYARFLSDNAETDALGTLLDDILAHAPRYGPALLERAKLVAREGKPREAIDAARLALSGEGNDPESIREARALLARSYFILGQKDEAAEEQQWVDDNPIAPAR